MPVLDLATLVDLRRKLNYEPGTRAGLPTRLTNPKEEGSYGQERIETGNSRCIAAHSFELTSGDFELAVGDLTIEFVGPPEGGAGIWVYHDVPMSTYVEFSQAASLGTYFNLYIKEQFSPERV